MVIARHDGREFFSSSDEHWLLGRHDLSPHDHPFGALFVGRAADRIIIEQRIVRHPAFEQVAVGGTPDVRIVLYRCVPVMAMVRLPTRQSPAAPTSTGGRRRRRTPPQRADPRRRLR